MEVLHARLHLDQIVALDAALACLDEEVSANVELFHTAIEMLSSIPGISTLLAEGIVAEFGIDMRRFQTVGHRISWAGLCPKNDPSTAPTA